MRKFKYLKCRNCGDIGEWEACRCGQNIGMWFWHEEGEVYHGVESLAEELRRLHDLEQGVTLTTVSYTDWASTSGTMYITANRV